VDGLERLIARAGTWRGTMLLQDPGSGIEQRSDSLLDVVPVVKGRFVRVDYTWSHDGNPQEGSILLGLNPETGALQAAWVDSWHMSHAMMVCAGESTPEAEISVTGSYAAPPGPDWGWRIALDAAAGDALLLRMYNIPPAMDEQLAVEATYRRTEVTLASPDA
jgi:hypothetical protein